ncbi:MAG: hypothetical protein LBN32_04505 [Helicobacteraceae bacterium]|nr:hypothetical protein [Helicobacteraceae bacterium]
MPDVTVLLISAAQPAKLAVYDDRFACIERLENALPLSEWLYGAMKSIVQRYNVARVAYARGPGSFMGLKLGYLFMRSFSLAARIPFVAASSFDLTSGAPIKAHGKRWFVIKDGAIAIESFETPPADRLLLPDQLDMSMFSGAVLPEYVLNAV